MEFTCSHSISWALFTLRGVGRAHYIRLTLVCVHMNLATLGLPGTTHGHLWPCSLSALSLLPSSPSGADERLHTRCFYLSNVHLNQFSLNPHNAMRHLGQMGHLTTQRSGFVRKHVASRADWQENCEELGPLTVWVRTLLSEVHRILCGTASEFPKPSISSSIDFSPSVLWVFLSGHRKPCFLRDGLFHGIVLVTVQP